MHVLLDVAAVKTELKAVVVATVVVAGVVPVVEGANIGPPASDNAAIFIPCSLAADGSLSCCPLHCRSELVESMDWPSPEESLRLLDKRFCLVLMAVPATSPTSAIQNVFVLHSKEGYKGQVINR